MRSEEYWAGRMEQLNEAELRKGEDYIHQQNAEYDKAMARIRKETDAWYGRLAKNNDISMAEARKLLTANELKEFHWDVQEYIQRGRENAVDQRWIKQLENASAKVHITRLEELETKLRQETELLAARRVKGTTELMAGIYKDGYYKGIYEVQRGTGVGIPFARLDARQIDKVLAKPWTPDGRNFSSRIWADRDKLFGELQRVLTQDLIRGESADKVISNFATRMGVSKSVAERLVLTEAAYFSGQSRIDGYKETGVTQYKFVSTLDSRTSEACRHLDGEIILLSEAKAGVNYPPVHAYCRSTTIPHYDDSTPTGERAARDDDDGKTYYVPGDMTYKDWAARHAPKDATNPPDPGQPKPSEPPRVTPAAPSPPLLPFVPAKTLQEAEAAARREYGFDDVSYKGLDLENANAVNQAIETALTEFPSLKGFAKKISVVDSDSFLAQASIQYKNGAVVSDLKVSSRYFNSKIDDTIEASVLAGHWPQGSNRRSVIVHEFGHFAEYAHAIKLLGGWTGVRMDVDDIQTAFARLKKGNFSGAIVAEALDNLGLPNTPEVIKRELSAYATIKTQETLAEAVAEAVGTSKPRRLALEIVKVLQRKMKEVGL